MSTTSKRPVRDQVAVARWSGQAGPLTMGAAAVSLLAICAGAGVLGIAAIGPLWPVADIAAHLTWHALGAVFGGCAGLVASLVRRPVVALCIVATAAVATLAIPPLLAKRAELSWTSVGPRPAAGVIRIVSLNAWHSNAEPERLVVFLERVQADVVILTEFGPNKAPLLRRLSRSYPHHVGCGERYYCGVQILARSAMRLISITSRDRGTGPPAVAVRFGADLKHLVVHGVHLMRPIDSRWGNYNEVEQLARWVRETRGPVVVAGDFNLTAWSANWRKFHRESGLVHMGRFLPSWPASPRGMPQLAIDHIFASPGLTFETVWVSPPLGSDHLALIADIRLP